MQIEDMMEEVYKITMENGKKLAALEIQVTDLKELINKQQKQLDKLDTLVNELQDKAGKAALQAWRWIVGMIGAAAVSALISRWL